jgi:hypothetical protein
VQGLALPAERGEVRGGKAQRVTLQRDAMGHRAVAMIQGRERRWPDKLRASWPTIQLARFFRFQRGGRGYNHLAVSLTID